MPDGIDARAQQIEKRIDPQISGAIALSGSGGALSIAPQNMAEMFEFAKMMAVSGPCVRPAFRGSPGACLAIALQAFRTGADPFAVANKAYITTSRSGDEQIAYEAQYIHAVLNTSGKLAKRLRPTYSGEGQARKCTITGYVVGEDEPLTYESPTIGEIPVKNSPLWKGDPDQQLFYYSARAWGRRHLPEVLLGMYTPDEIRGEVIDITPGPPAPRPRPEDYAETAMAAEEEESDEAEQAETSFAVTDQFGETHDAATEEDAIEAMTGWIGEVQSLRSLEGLMESNLTWAPYPLIIEAYKNRKSELSKSGTTEHPEARQSSTPTERIKPAGVVSPNAPSDAAPRDEPKQETEALRKLARVKGYLNLKYWTRKACEECRDPSDIDELSRVGEPSYKTLSPTEYKEIRELIDSRNRELSV